MLAEIEPVHCNAIQTSTWTADEVDAAMYVGHPAYLLARPRSPSLFPSIYLTSLSHSPAHDGSGRKHARASGFRLL